ncbi:hypothetical protein AC579_261 [Pseudocercospora musae]|uniref:Uncharacterized protein n=1 Tax=Pseudocercospora musae TaxID=113226 RepID=A0A139I3N2_9PEZI|nr:hypothetical protein AC579_261 [Pseudocercospora musae]
MDVCEPMHTSIRALGGNRFLVTFNGTETNMHQTWRIRGEQNGKVGFREPIDDWAICNWDIERGTYCPEKWAQSSNAIVCDYACGRYVNGSDVYKDGYARGAYHIVDLQLAKAAWRLAGWLNSLAGMYLNKDVAEVEGIENPIRGVDAYSSIRCIETCRSDMESASSCCSNLTAPVQVGCFERAPPVLLLLLHPAASLKPSWWKVQLVQERQQTAHKWLAKTGSLCCDLKKVLKLMHCGFPIKERTSMDFMQEIEVGTRELIKLVEAISDPNPPTQRDSGRYHQTRS